jgi:hypothetical protein
MVMDNNLGGKEVHLYLSDVLQNSHLVSSELVPAQAYCGRVDFQLNMHPLKAYCGRVGYGN